MLEVISAFWSEYGGILLTGTRDTLVMVLISVFLFRQRPFHSGQPYLDRHISPPYSSVFPFFFILQPDFPHVKAHG